MERLAISKLRLKPKFTQRWLHFVRTLVILEMFALPLLEVQSLPDELAAGRFSAALFTLGQVPQGVALLKKAIQIWELEEFSDLLKRFKWGYTSRTDTILTRYYNPKSGKEDRESDVTIYLRKDQSQFELVMDMAHELVHATARAGFDPYDSSLTAGKYIWAAIEGEGGEVQATLTECQIGLELAGKLGTNVPRCEPYRSKRLEGLEKNSSAPATQFLISRDKVLRDFYRVGKWQPALHQLLGVEYRLFPHLTPETPQLYSSTGHTPYPIALFHEFEEITESACKNSQNRMRSFASEDLKRFISKRCK